LKTIDRETVPEFDLHLIVDNYATHKHPKVKAWLKRHPRFHIHFIPTSSSWLNVIERWFAELTNKRIRRGVFRSVQQLVKAIEDYVDRYNDAPEGYQWTKSAAEILAKVSRAKAALDKCLSE
jgi:transposase